MEVINQSGQPFADTDVRANRQAVPPKSWLLESILVTLFCCLPFGIVGIIRAANVESLFYAGKVEESVRASREAKKWTVIGFWVGLSVGILYGIFMLIAALAGIDGVWDR